MRNSPLFRSAICQLALVPASCSVAQSLERDAEADVSIAFVPLDAAGRDGGPAINDGGGRSPDASDIGVTDVGTPCTWDRECPTSSCDRVAGRCAQRCGPRDVCSLDSTCTVDGDCVRTCEGGCPAGSVCWSVPAYAPVPVCRAGCTDDSNCTDGTRCSSLTRSCYRAGVASGGPCAGERDCGEGQQCFDEEGFGASGGLCSDVCALGRSDCGFGSRCVQWFFAGGADFGTCLAECDDRAACRTGWQCLPFDMSGTRVCVPRCERDTDCSSGLVCNIVTGLCA
jgi:hypothetical protein